jgi:hypothetical protein
VLERQIHGASLIATLGVELDCLIKFTLLLEVLRTLDHDWLGTLKGHGQYLLVIPTGLGKSDGVVQSGRLAVVDNGLTDVVLLLVVAG